MVVNAILDLPFDPLSKSNRIILMMRREDMNAGVDHEIQKDFRDAILLPVETLTEGQACTCLLADQLIDSQEPLLIAACDNGMDLDHAAFQSTIADADAAIFTFRHNESVSRNPRAYGWVRESGGFATGVSIKVPISDDPVKDHAVVGAFWFKQGSAFVQAAQRMIAANDRINGEFYVDQIFKYLIDDGQCVRVFEIDRYLCWGTPADYEAYEQTIDYWAQFLEGEGAR
jgi:hypothetical protein